ncbi:MAG: hypothetical protein LIP01_06410 [Tannerellaceae bacterium]|nr:hypothetical protein [Tannerellaceae bacterium]
MATHNCERCPIRAKYDKNPRSLLGRFWRWHINFCPGWKKYMQAQDETVQNDLRMKYNLKK